MDIKEGFDQIDIIRCSIVSQISTVNYLKILSIKMYKRTVIIFVIVMAYICAAQVNFTPNWGKRGINQSPGMDNNCKASVDAIMMIYKLIQVINNLISISYYLTFSFQTEAQKLVECDKFSK